MNSLESIPLNKHEGHIQWSIYDIKSTSEYVPKWKRIIANILNIPIRPKYMFSVIAKTEGLPLDKGYMVRFIVDDKWYHFICKGTASFAGINWILTNVELQHEIPEQKEGEGIIQLLHRGVLNDS